ncbi:MAG: hypothetical protein QXS24_02690 [Desulfurococcaceae archaeon]
MNLLMNICKSFMDYVPPINEFLTVSELRESSMRFVRENSDIAELVEVGLSRSGDPIEALIIRGGEKKRVLAFGFPHPNEPVGSMTLEVLTNIFSINRDFLRKTEATWIIVKVADVMGAKLNEGWFKGGFDIVKYTLNYYRPPGYKQVEWSFPIEYKELKFSNPTPETLALMKLIDEWKPTHIYSLHNAGFSGTYYYVTKDPGDRVLDVLYKVPYSLGVPVHRGEPEAPYMKKLHEGVFLMPSTSEIYDWLEKYLGRSPVEAIKHGGSSYDYAKKVNPDVFELVSEVPYIYDEKLSNDTPIGIPRREILRLGIGKEEELLMDVEKEVEIVEPYMSSDNPFFESLTYFLEVGKKHLEAEKKWIEEDPSLDESATVAQAFDAYTVPVFYGGLLRYGLLYRSIVFESNRTRLPENIMAISHDAYAKIMKLADVFKKYSRFYVVPVDKLVRIQLAAIISTILGVY